MRLTTMITTLFLAIQSAYTFPTGETLVTINLFGRSRTCGGAPTTPNLVAGACYSIAGNNSLRVIEHKAGLFYNSLHVYPSAKCNVAWTLQPLQDNCSDVSAYESIMVVT
ncbi:hypothetical protein HBI25_207290 [Parastagonospora nodorum]|nr:hypothetical protein HBH53_237890 [Parastagonospora nodorum]KAH3956789.1 hypothetical protein HBH51_235480 [Parastagonospora nodorum]KAH3964320.1 hypothetical protein HBH52_213230 [Parastagonospora nodorum]KAH4044069.1 hypothetical protein HBH49_224950 [Parastagonospora nodorum]KAH4112322.1 hypothetical protein HBH47_228220 [Parastagonospora nodorum]